MDKKKSDVVASRKIIGFLVSSFLLISLPLVLLYNSQTYAELERPLIWTVLAAYTPPKQLPTRSNPYIIKHFDTLWDLAFKFYGDPYRWREIWNANNYIQNPHWIYPGNSLLIPGISGWQNTQGLSPIEIPDDQQQYNMQTSSDTLMPEDTSEHQNREEEISGLVESIDSLKSYKVPFIFKNGYLGPDMLRKIGFLWTQRDEKNIIAPGNAYIDGGKNKTTCRQFEQVNCTIFGSHDYKIGDTVDIIHPEEYLKFKDEVANLVYRVALGRIDKIEPRGKKKKASMKVTLFKVWDVVRNKDRIAPATHFKYHRIDSVYAAKQEIAGKVIKKINSSVSPFLYQVIIIDQGSRHGVQFGDIFKVYHRRYNFTKTKYKQDIALIGCALNIQEESSSLLVMKMMNYKLTTGDDAQLMQRAKFN